MNKDAGSRSVIDAIKNSEYIKQSFAFSFIDLYCINVVTGQNFAHLLFIHSTDNSVIEQFIQYLKVEFDNDDQKIKAYLDITDNAGNSVLFYYNNNDSLAKFDDLAKSDDSIENTQQVPVAVPVLEPVKVDAEPVTEPMVESVADDAEPVTEPMVESVAEESELIEQSGGGSDSIIPPLNISVEDIASETQLNSSETNPEPIVNPTASSVRFGDSFIQDSIQPTTNIDVLEVDQITNVEKLRPETIVDTVDTVDAVDTEDVTMSIMPPVRVDVVASGGREMTSIVGGSISNIQLESTSSLQVDSIIPPSIIEFFEIPQGESKMNDVRPNIGGVVENGAKNMVKDFLQRRIFK